MKLIKFNSVKLAIIVSVIYSITRVLLVNSLSYLVVDNVYILLRNGIIIIFIYIVNAIIMAMNEKCKAVSAYYVKRQLNSRIDKYYEKILFTDFHSKTVGERANTYVSHVSKIVNLTLYRIISIIFNFSLIFFILFSLYLIHPFIFLLGIGLAIVLWIVQRQFDNKLSKYVILSQNESENFLKKITEILLGYSVFVENTAFRRFKIKSEMASERYANSIAEVDIFAGRISAVLTFISHFFTVISTICLSYLVIRGKISAGFLLSVIGLIPMLGDALETVISERAFYKSGKDLYAEKFENIGEEYDEKFTKPFISMKDEGTSFVLPSITTKKIKTIEIHNLSVKYGDKVIHYKDILLEAGKKYALVGKSGCGKSTLLKTIIGEICDYEGDVVINGKVKDKEQMMFDYIAYVNQNVFLFNESLRDNINLDNDNVMVGNLLKKVDFEDLSLDEEISENGKNLSGGQRQRIALARALARNKKILFLDEITAALDSESSQFIEDMILDDDSMVVIITHKLSEKTRKKLDYVIDLSQT